MIRVCPGVAWRIAPLVVIVCLMIAAALTLDAQSTDRRSKPTAAGRKVALVIGSNAYPSAPLVNAVADARAISSSAGLVSVKLLESPNRFALADAVSEFAGTLRADDVAMFFSFDPTRAIAGDAPVASAARANPWGLIDICGDALEWTSSVLRPYPYRSDDGREALESENRNKRAVRGGAAVNGQDGFRSAARQPRQSHQAEADIGFRCAR